MRTFWSLLLAAAVLAGSCAKDELGQAGETAPDDGLSAKLVFSADNARQGELLVCFSSDAAERIESAVGAMTRACGIATRSGIGDFDAVLDGIGVKTIRRLFPVDSRHEERTRAAGLHRWYFVGFDADADLDFVARQMAAVAEVSKVEFNQQLRHVACGEVVPLTESPVVAPTRAAVQFDDPYLERQWHYINTGNTTLYDGIKVGADVNCAEAWRLCTGDPRVVVAVLDDTLATGKGICFDYAALMSAMLRSQGIPTKLVVGYSGDAYHAWISVHLEEIGWVNDIIEFDGTGWSLMDPTLAAGNSESAVKKYIGDGTNYIEKYSY